MTALLDALGRDARHAVRSLLRAPGFAAVVVTCLALGIGANTAIFSLLNAVLLRSLPVPEPDRLVQLGETGDRPPMSWTNPIWEDLRDRESGPVELFAWSPQRVNLAEHGEARFVPGLLTSGSFFRALRLKARIGRIYTAEEDRRGCGTPPAVLSHGFWQSHFAGAPDAIGKPLVLDGQVFTVVGVAPPGFFGVNVGQSFDVAVPLCAEPLLRGADTILDHRSAWWLTIMARLAPGASIAEARAALQAAQPSVREATLPPDWSAEDRKEYLAEPWSWIPAGAGVSYLRARYRQALLVLTGIVTLVLLLACANIANLLLARSVARGREIAVRVSLGASRARLVSQLLAESALLGLLGAAGAIAVARVASRLLVAQLSTERTAVFLDLGLDPRVLGFTAGTGLLTGLLFGILPALRASGKAPADTLRQLSRGSGAGGGRLRAARWLVALQVGLSCVIVVGAALFLRTYAELSTLDAGFDRRGVLIVGTDLRRTGVVGEARLPLFQRVLEAVRAVPGVRQAAFSAVTPISGSTWQYTIQSDGFEPKDRRDSGAYYNFVSPDYFATLGTALLAGRDVEDRDTATAPKVAVVNESFARRFFPGKSPIGLRYRTEEHNVWHDVEIVGLVRDARYRSLRDDVPPTAYAPVTQLTRALPGFSFSVQARGDLRALRPALVEAIGAVNPDISLTFRTFESQVADSLVQERLVATLSALFGLLGLTIAGVGLAGLVAYSVNSRRGELGVRSALGATPGSLVRLMLREVLLLTAVGVAIGTAVSLAAGHLVAALLYGVAPNDPLTLSVAAGVLAWVAVLAGYLPARRAARVDPMECLRAE
jgi:putative ABC transport system permease protein